jgi:hypothetical protein
MSLQTEEMEARRVAACSAEAAVTAPRSTCSRLELFQVFTLPVRFLYAARWAGVVRTLRVEPEPNNPKDLVFFLAGRRGILFAH